MKEEGYGNCPSCRWFGVPEGCNVKRDSEICLLNKKKKENNKCKVNGTHLKPKEKGPIT